MNKTFGDLKTGDFIYYIDWDEYKKVYSIFKHSIFVHEPRNIDIIENTIKIDIKINIGEYYSHRITDLSLSKDKNTVKWGKPDNIVRGHAKGGLAITVDYDEAKKICLSFMRQYCEIMRERTKSMASEMYEAITKFNDMLENYVG
jgi:hypothetical protein